MSKYTPGPWQSVENIVFSNGFTYVKIIHEAESKANAKLIAAAPDLLEALQKLESAFMVHTQWNGEPLAEIKSARAAIKKATE